MVDLFFCESCRKQLGDACDLHFVEDSSDRGFCSENCILNFYRPYMAAFESEERAFRKKLLLEDEVLPQQILESDDYLQQSLDKPSEVYSYESEIGQRFYTHITELFYGGDSYFSIMIVSYIDHAPSFVFYRTITQSQSLINLYRRGDSVLDSLELGEINSTSTEETEEFDISDEVMEEVEVKKSMILADLLIKRSDEDISFEHFIVYDEYLEKTLQAPDEIYEFHDAHGDKLYTNIKSFKNSNESFFYIVLTYPYQFKSGSDGVIQIPIIGFPSKDEKLYPKYAQGKLINEKLRN